MSQQYPPGWQQGPPPGYPQQHPQHPQAPYPHHGPGYGPPPGYGQHPQPQGGAGASIGRIIVGVFAGVIVLAGLGIGGMVIMNMDNATSSSSRSGPGRSAPEDPLVRERASLMANPNAFLDTSDLVNYDKGIINDYRQLTSVTVLNRSHFPVQNMSGDVEWVNESGARVASMPFTLKGSIAAGDTKRFSQAEGTLSNGTVQSSARKLRVKFTHIDIVE